jgi:hypothetical protein
VDIFLGTREPVANANSADLRLEAVGVVGAGVGAAASVAFGAGLAFVALFDPLGRKGMV